MLGPAPPCARSVGSERRHDVLVACAECDGTGPGGVCARPPRTVAVWLCRAAVPRDRSALARQFLRPVRGRHKRRASGRMAPPCSVPASCQLYRQLYRPAGLVWSHAPAGALGSRCLTWVRGAVSESVSDGPLATL